MVNAIAARLVGLLPSSLQPYAKALVPGVLTAGGVLGNLAATGTLDTEALCLSLVGLATTALTFVLPNKTV